MVSRPHPDFARLKMLLEQQEKFPVQFTVKFIGRNTALFQKGISQFEQEHPILTLQGRRESSGSKHLAMTYVFEARNADHIIETLKRLNLIEDLLVIL